MLLFMRTTVDLPDALMQRIKYHTANKKVTFRSLVITALEKELSTKKKIVPAKGRFSWES